MTSDVDQIVGLDRLQDARVREAVEALCRTIRPHSPDAEFQVFPNPSYRGAMVKISTDTDDFFEITNLVSDRRVDLLVDEDLSIRLAPRCGQVRRRWHDLRVSQAHPRAVPRGDAVGRLPRGHLRPPLLT